MPVQLFQKDASFYKYEYRVEPISEYNSRILKFSYKNGKRMRGRKNVPEFVDLIVAKNDVLKFLLTCKDGDNFKHLVDTLRLASEKMYNSDRIASSCELIYSHAFKYRHFLFIEYFMQVFQNHKNSIMFLQKGLEILLKSKLKHIEFFRMFFQFQHYFESKDKSLFEKVCANNCALILKNHNWDFFKHYVTLWQNRPFEEFITLAGYAIKKYVHINKFIRLLHECCLNDDAHFMEYYKKELTFVAYEECTKKHFYFFRHSFAHILFMYGADKYTDFSPHLLRSYEKDYPKYEAKFAGVASLLSLLYCFERRSIQLIF